MDRIIQLLINAGALYVAVLVVPNLDFSFESDNAWLRFLVVAFIFGIVNTLVKPLLQLFLVVVNALMLLLSDAISDQLDLGLVVGDFLAALLGAIVISIVSLILSMVVGAVRRTA